MKILHIQLTEHKTFEELRENIKNAGIGKFLLFKTKKAAIKSVKEQTDVRVFWVGKATYNNVTTFVLYETLID